MKFSNRVDVAASAEFLFDQLSDFSAFERAALKKGISLRRLDSLAAPGAGMSWDIGFRLRGRARQLIADIRRFERPTRLDYEGTSQGFQLMLGLELTALSPGRTRLTTALELRPRTLGARLLLQSAKLGRAKLERRYDERVKSFLREIEERAAAQA